MTERKLACEALRLTCQATCGQCGREVSGWLALDDALTVCDSGGFLLAGQKPHLAAVCDDCCRHLGLPGDEAVNGPPDFDRAAEALARGLTWKPGRRRKR